MEDIRIKFVDFWEKFDPHENYFYRILSKKYNVILSDDPEILFYSCYSGEYLNYKCVKVFYSPENVRADFTACDFALTFEYNKSSRHFRLPLYLLYMERLALQGIDLKVPTREQAIATWKAKTKFCCMVVSTTKATERIGFFNDLNSIKRVDSGGRYLNNIGGPVADKAAFIKDYKFVISYENASCDGYTTEKILEPFYAGCIPVYWGNKLVEREFNGNRFLNRHDFSSNDQLIKRILEIDGNDELAIEMLCRPYFTGAGGSPSAMNGVEDFIYSIVENRKMVTPAAGSYKKHLHKINRFRTRVRLKIESFKKK